MLILGIHDGHTATACLLKDGEIKSMASEERFTNIKNSGGFPLKTIEWILQQENIKANEFDAIAFPGLLIPINDISAYNRDRHKWYKLASKYLPGSILSNEYLSNLYVQRNRKKRESLDSHDKEFKQLGLQKEKCQFIEHHEAHAATAYYLDFNYSPDRKVLVFTLDGSGDGISATVNIGHKGKLNRIASIPSYHSLGILYSRMTAYLGMKPLEHEYKLMGMAPYAPDYLVEKSYNVLKNYYRLDNSGLFFENTSGVWGHELIHKFQKDLLMHRFDGICGALQKITEELCLQWILNWIKKTNINEIAVSGGVFMNVKLNMLINENKEVKNVFFMPSCGDESIALGAALMVEANRMGEAVKPHKLKNLYFGPEYSNEYIKRLLESQNKFKYEYFDDINTEVVKWLINSKIVGRFKGRMEFGARSLGNRSILSNPFDYNIVSKVNRAIKMRDFWMPFAPSILPSGAERYLVSGKVKKAPFMILGYETTNEAQEIKSGLHQSDFSCRPQIVEQDINPEYYDLLQKFEKSTGISGVMNTSFNIHGYPIVNTPETALWTFENSGLDAIQLENYLVTKV